MEGGGASEDAAVAERLAAELIQSPSAALKKASKQSLDAFLRIAVDRYHNSDAPNIVPDHLYDAVLLAYKKKYPKSDVPLVAAPHAQDAHRVRLPVWMGSLTKIVDDPHALARWRAAHPGGHVLSDKLDGISGLLEVSARGARLMTRGDGVDGRDVSGLLRLMHHVKLPPAPPAGEPPVLVRGELIIPKAEFLALRRGATARNLANGVVNASKNPDAEVAGVMHFVAYELIPGVASAKSMSPSQQIGTLRAWGLPTVEAWTATSESLTQEILSARLLKRQADCPYEIDGIVVTEDQAYARETGKNPTTAFAFKTMLALSELTTTVRSVEWEVSKDGLLKPTVVFDPVTLDGKKVQRTTGHNARFVETNRIGPGARVRVILSGRVIPHLLGRAEGGPEVAPQMPTTPWVWDATHVEALLDPNARTTKGSRDLGVRQLLHFCESMKIAGVGPGMVERLYAAGFTTPDVLTSATAEAFLKVSGVRAPRAHALHEAVAAAIAKASCATIAEASNRFGHGIGRQKLLAVMEAIPGIASEGAVPTADQLRDVPNVGPKTAQTIIKGAAAFAAFLQENPLLAARCKAQGQGQGARGGPAAAAAQEPPAINLTGRVFVFTGFTSDPLKAYIERSGGRVTGSVSASTTAVIAKDPEAGSTKIKDAARLGVRVVALESLGWDGVKILSVDSLTP